jgi:site-specific recombinase XerD
VFTSERGSPFTTAGWRKMVARLGVAAKLGFKAHPHMFRYACGFQLTNQGTNTRVQAYPQCGRAFTFAVSSHVTKQGLQPASGERRQDHRSKTVTTPH